MSTVSVYVEVIRGTAKTFTATFTVNDVAVGFDAVITPAIIGTVSISIISQPIDIQVQGRTVDVLLTGRTVTVTVEPS